MKSCQIPKIDKANKVLVKEAKLAISKNDKEHSKLVLTKIREFRMQLAYNKATESLETNFGWTLEYDKINATLQKVIGLGNS
ncbi:hypothetical protein [Lacihabitans soyangensis]|uniref:Uncharacterized protein n=1 Tax=Lacihabitans soyangensis TaxID=869394 RepID=A0AAE3KV74_9BACT|nr:hypothetical protein [Lacihabitans soyangensis]MCP9765773.1 hypothetical protein [Lacihabitans soyangensis]